MGWNAIKTSRLPGVPPMQVVMCQEYKGPEATRDIGRTRVCYKVLRLSTCFWILPAAVRGNSETTVISCGTL